MKQFFHRISNVATYITGTKMDYIMKLFYLYLSRMHVQSDLTVGCKSKSALAITSAVKKVEEEKVGAGAIDSAL